MKHENWQSAHCELCSERKEWVTRWHIGKQHINDQPFTSSRLQHINIICNHIFHPTAPPAWSLLTTWLLAQMYKSYKLLFSTLSTLPVVTSHSTVPQYCPAWQLSVCYTIVLICVTFVCDCNKRILYRIVSQVTAQRSVHSVYYQHSTHFDEYHNLDNSSQHPQLHVYR